MWLRTGKKKSALIVYVRNLRCHLASVAGKKEEKKVKSPSGQRDKPTEKMHNFKQNLGWPALILTQDTQLMLLSIFNRYYQMIWRLKQSPMVAKLASSKRWAFFATTHHIFTTSLSSYLTANHQFNRIYTVYFIFNHFWKKKKLWK